MLTAAHGKACSAAWPSIGCCCTAVRSFAEDYLEEMVMAAAGDVEADTPARTFLRILGDQIAFGRFRIGGFGPTIYDDDSREKEKVVGQLFRSAVKKPQYLNDLDDDDVIKLSIPFARAAVQEQLRREGRPELLITDRTLIEQLASLGCLLDPDSQQPITEGYVGERTKKARIGGKSVNAVCIRAAAFRGAWSDRQPGDHRSAETSPALNLIAAG